MISFVCVLGPCCFCPRELDDDGDDSDMQLVTTLSQADQVCVSMVMPVLECEKMSPDPNDQTIIISLKDCVTHELLGSCTQLQLKDHSNTIRNNLKTFVAIIGELFPMVF